MKTNMNKKVFRLMREAMSLETHRNSLSFTGKEIKVNIRVSPQFPGENKIVKRYFANIFQKPDQMAKQFAA